MSNGNDHKATAESAEVCTCSTDPLDSMPLIDGRCPVHGCPLPGVGNQRDRIVAGWTEVVWGALDYDGSMDQHPEREKAQADAEKYDLPLYRVTIIYEQVIPPASEGGRS